MDPKSDRLMQHLLKCFVMAFISLNVGLWLAVHLMNESEWASAYPYHCEACKTLVDTSIMALARDDAVQTAAAVSRSFRSFDFCDAVRYERFFGQQAYADHIDAEARADLLKACHLMLHLPHGAAKCAGKSHANRAHCLHSVLATGKVQ